MKSTNGFALRRFAPTVAALCLSVFVVGANDALGAALLIDQIPGAGGKLSYTGDPGDPLIGTNIIFEQITGLDTPLNDGNTLTLVDGKLNFTTGNNLIEGPAVWTWDGGGTFVLTADTVLDPSNTPIISGSDVVLLTGSFVANEAGYAVLGFSAGRNIQIASFGVDEKHPDILSYFGLDSTEFVFASSQISGTNLSVQGDGGFTATVLEADITNTPTPIPEPSTAALAVIAAATVFGLRRRLRGR